MADWARELGVIFLVVIVTVAIVKALDPFSVKAIRCNLSNPGSACVTEARFLDRASCEAYITRANWVCQDKGGAHLVSCLRDPTMTDTYTCEPR
jgi:hypothetical protein